MLDRRTALESLSPMDLLIARARHPWWSRALLPGCSWMGATAGVLAVRARDARVGFGHLPAVALFGIAATASVFVAAYAGRRVAWGIVAVIALYALALLSAQVDLSTEAIPGALALAGIAVVLSPILWLSRVAWREPVERSVAHECVVVAIYGLIVIAPTRHAYFDERIRVGAVIAAALAAVCLLGIGWDLVMRAQIRAVVAGRIAGWRVGEGDASEVPRLWWLNAFDPERSRVLYRVTEARDPYREARGVEVPVARVPPTIPRVGFASVLCAVLLVAALRLLADEH